jgi:hypothetical protein
MMPAASYTTAWPRTASARCGPDTTFRNVKADVLERFVPGF